MLPRTGIHCCRRKETRTEELNVMTVRLRTAAIVNTRVNETMRRYDYKIVAKRGNWSSATVTLRMTKLHAETKRLERAAVKETSVPLLH